MAEKEITQEGTGISHPINAQANVPRPIAWLIEKCPDFYFMPSMYFDKIFVEYGDPSVVMTCAYYCEIQKRTAIPLIPCEEAEATHWIVKQPNGVVKGIFDDETRESCEHLGYEIIAVKAAASTVEKG